jgi:hypothetical protein
MIQILYLDYFLKIFGIGRIILKLIINSSTTPFKIDIDSVEFIPYDDYLSNGKQLDKIIIDNIGTV